MSTNTAPIKNPSIFIKPSQKLIDYIKRVDVTRGLPLAISNIVFKNPLKSSNVELVKVDYLLTSEDKEFIMSVSSDIKNNITKLPLNSTTDIKTEKLLSLQDLYWLYEYINTSNKDSGKKIYLHELIEGSEIVLPKNQEVPRNPELELRCQKLKAQQENKVYQDMTKNVDNVRKKYPEDTIAYQSEYFNFYCK